MSLCISHKSVYITQFWFARDKSKLWDKKSQFFFYFFISWQKQACKLWLFNLPILTFFTWNCEFKSFLFRFASVYLANLCLCLTILSLYLRICEFFSSRIWTLNCEKKVRIVRCRNSFFFFLFHVGSLHSRQSLMSHLFHSEDQEILKTNKTLL